MPRSRPRLGAALAALAGVLAFLAAPLAGGSQPQYAIKLATVAPEGSPWAAGLGEFKVYIEKHSGGRLKLRNFLGGTLGDENETVQQCRRGQIQAVGASVGAIASIVPEMNVIELPYLFRSEAEADYVLDQVVSPKFGHLFTQRGLALAFWSENGFRSFGTRSRAVKSPADLKGLKMRSQESPVHLAMYRAMGASPVQIPTTEALTSLQTGVVDGFDQTPLYTQAASWDTTIKHYTASNHIYQPAAIVFNGAFYTSLPPDLKNVIQEGSRQVVGSLRRQIRALNPLLMENFAASGIAVYTPTAAERAAFEKAGAAGRTAYMNAASAGEKQVYDAIVAGLKQFRAGKK